MEQIIDRLERIEQMLSKQAVPREYLSIDEAAEFIGVSRQTMDRWRMEASGPAVHRVGRRVLYSLVDLRAYMESHRERAVNRHPVN
jgi:excisionase family DNA binding protein